MSALIYGADLIINQSEKIALKHNISHFVIGATLIAPGTSLPEMAASMMASYDNKGELAVSNVLGSNIFNIGLVLGSVFLISKNMNPTRDFLRKDSAWLIFPLFTFLLISYDGVISRVDGVLLLLIMATYVYYLFKNPDDIEDDLEEDKEYSSMKVYGFLLLGLVFVVIGAKFTIDSATIIATDFGVSQWVIGLLLIALGTSLPELIVSIVAAKKGHSEMAIGNIIGSNMANFTIVLGSSALINPLIIDLSLGMFDILANVLMTFTLIFIIINKLYNKSAGLILMILTAVVVIHHLG